MKFSQIKKICKDADECIIFREGPMRWIGTQDAAYPLEDVDVTTASVKTLFDWQDVESAIGVVEKTLEDMGLAPDGVVRCDVESNNWEKLTRGITLFNGGEKNSVVRNRHAGAVRIGGAGAAGNPKERISGFQNRIQP